MSDSISPSSIRTYFTFNYRLEAKESLQKPFAELREKMIEAFKARHFQRVADYALKILADTSLTFLYKTEAQLYLNGSKVFIQRFSQAKAFELIRDYQKALNEINQLLKDYPEHAEAQEFKCLCEKNMILEMYQTGKYGEAHFKAERFLDTKEDPQIRDVFNRLKPFMRGLYLQI